MPPSDQLDQYQPCRFARSRSTTISGSSLRGSDSAEEQMASNGPSAASIEEKNMICGEFYVKVVRFLPRKRFGISNRGT